MRLALAQINPTVGDLAGNAAIIESFARRARDTRADAVVFPELALTGYPPKDLLLQGGFLEDTVAAAKRLGEGPASRGITLIFGTPLPVTGGDEDDLRAGEGAVVRPKGAAPAAARAGVANSLLAYRDAALVGYYDKRLLPTYDVFDEDRYFVPGSRPEVVTVADVRAGLSVCEDLWRGEDVGFASRYASLPDPVLELVSPVGAAGQSRPGAQAIVNPSASPFVLGKGRRHRDLLRRHAVTHRVHVAAVNQVGGNDELVFDGHAAVFDPHGNLIAAGKGFEEDLVVVDLAPGKPGAPVADPMLATPDDELLYRALVLGVRDYLRKTGFAKAVLGLSGGIDSAVTAVLAAAALGPANVLGVSLPSRYSSEGSKSDAAELARRLGIACLTLPIEDGFTALTATLAPARSGADAPAAADLTEQNLQSRIRGTLLMALSNLKGHLLLTTGNKSELAVGYCTLYGDMNGGLAVLSDVTKQSVYRLARWINANPARLGLPGATPPIPEPSITKPPSAELRPNQTDQDSLPPYEVLDEIIERYVERRQSARHIVAESGIDAATVARCVRLIDLSEFKRKQAAIGLKVTGVAFGSGRRMPIAQRYRPSASP